MVAVAGGARPPGIGIEFIRFALVGAADTLVQFGVFNILWRIFGVPDLLATAAGVVLATANSYVLNRLWTFGHRHGAMRREFPLFALLNLASLGLTVGLVAAGQSTFGAHGFVAVNAVLLAATAVAGVLRFLAFRRWVFRPVQRPADISVELN